ncbi:MAG: hypothetical protein CMI18_05980 [Opitutaceae bacterium]|nr:hypothetical protein [Opitutaceae bacterium]|tara:strand:+ start:2054 stop:3328 length:1275 start_codon:yes stop_codon:yes gene_type:complete
MHKFSLNRRQFLRAVGVSLALPTLGSWPKLSAATEIATQAAKAKRLICMGANLGLHGPSLFPKETGRDYSVTPLLKDLMRHKDQLSLFSGLDHRAPNGHKHWDNLLCGRQAGDVSLDQIAAKEIGKTTRFESLQLSSGKGSFRQKMVFNHQGIPLPMVERPSVVYQTLFGIPDNVERTEYLLKSGHSSLDKVTDEAKRLQGKVSSDDRDKLDEYFSSVRDLEQRMGRQLKGLHEPRPEVNYKLPEYDPIAPTLMLENQALMYDLMALALETDSTRVITMFLPGLGQVFTINGKMLSAGYHALSHHGNNPGLIADLIKVEGEHMRLLAEFLDQLKSKKDAEGKPLLDSTLVMWGAGMGDASRHSNANLPIILAGGGLKHGNHFSFDRDAQDAPLLGDLYITMLQQLGLEAGSFSNASSNLNQHLI